MPQLLKRAGSFFFALLIVLSLFPAKAQAFAASHPQQLYQHVWQLVRDSYYDPTFNNQNWETWHHKFDGKLQGYDQSYDAIKQMLNSLNDPYTRFLDRKAFQAERDAIQSQLCGIGISLHPNKGDKDLIVNEVLEGGPAAAAGIRYGDQVVAINGTKTTSLTHMDAAEQIRGNPGTKLVLSMKREGQTHDYTLVRQRIEVPPVTSKVLDSKVGYIKLSTFMADDAARSFRANLSKLAGVEGLVIDLRNNPGGLIANAVDIADMLMGRGDIVTTVSRYRAVTDSCSGGLLADVPLVLLVDHDSASASEILAGALQDNSRATVVGSTTYGKGLVQEIYRLPNDAAIHLTVARYFTPSGKNINKIGIKPDLVVEERDQQLDRAVAVLKNLMAKEVTISRSRG